AFETPAIVAFAGVIALLGSWGLYLGADAAGEWDSLRLFHIVIGVVALLSALLLLTPRVVQKAVVSLIILVHFTAIIARAAGEQPGPWVMRYLSEELLGSYIQFTALTNAYRFYSPEPAPSSQMWFRLLYEDDRGAQFSRWIKMPDTDENGRHRYGLALRNQR